MKIWDLRSGLLIRELIQPAEAVWRVAFEDERSVVLASRHGRTVMELWDFTPPDDDDDRRPSVRQKARPSLQPAAPVAKRPNPGPGALSSSVASDDAILTEDFQQLTADAGADVGDGEALTRSGNGAENVDMVDAYVDVMVGSPPEGEGEDGGGPTVEMTG